MSLYIGQYLYKCFYCLRHYDVDRSRTIDHIIPKSKGGKENQKNKLFCCDSCNREKQDFMPLEFLDHLDKQLIRLKGNKIALPSIMVKISQVKLLINEIAPYEFELRRRKHVIEIEDHRYYYDEMRVIQRAELISYFPVASEWK